MLISYFLFLVILQFIPTTLTLDSGVTRPPSLLSETDLLNCMDKAGIGADATMHDHIKKLLDRFYATKDFNTRFSPTNLGEALVMGYDDMGYELWKPYLRAMMENDMKAVSIGTKRKAEVLSTCLEQMKACFLDACSSSLSFIAAVVCFVTSQDPFNLGELNIITKKLRLACLGSFAAVIVYSLFKFFCYVCSNSRSGADEQHAVGDAVRRCGVCQESDMVLKRKPIAPIGPFNDLGSVSKQPYLRLSFFYLVLDWNVVWLPGSIAEAIVTTNVCSVCSPGCIGGCDEILKQLVEICGPGSRNLSSTPASGQGTATSSSSVQRSNSRQIACTHCRQYGHSSNDCPSQTSRSSRARSQGMNQQSEEESFTRVNHRAATSLRRWEDSLNNSNRGRSVPRANVSSSASNTIARGGRGRGGRSGRAVDTTFVSATGARAATIDHMSLQDLIHPNLSHNSYVLGHRTSGQPSHVQPRLAHVWRTLSTFYLALCSCGLIPIRNDNGAGRGWAGITLPSPILDGRNSTDPGPDPL
ncbi:hypothetical protein TEA_018797 [Camellia sinensis var. sinensis]|uniref:DNA topoisomerase n=1 Tax=Camellia sinensis var. sinensis TaxID=542762 RepID=A0A4S4D998_CAMSN|nr:hypothetical protein TEA_018797 [Camellia sinensis var. sinensis]